MLPSPEERKKESERIQSSVKDFLQLIAEKKKGCKMSLENPFTRLEENITLPKFDCGDEDLKE
ncbi:MAG: hypothetical protein J1E95_08195 [Muribaculaceae bacterium]|nr:hypothetical protein [Muribaculaceae bacterium]